MRIILIVLAVLLPTSLCTMGAAAQEMQPLELAQRIFAREPFPELKQYATGEYTGQPAGVDLPATTFTKFRLLGQTDTHAVVTLTLMDSTDRGVDVYLHFRKDTVWKLAALRAFALIGALEKVYDELSHFSERQIDSMIAKSKVDKDSYVMFASRADFDYQLYNTRLTLAIDDTIATYFDKNRERFEKLRSTITARRRAAKKDAQSQSAVWKSFRTETRALLLESVSASDACDQCITFLIGGMVDDAVGYLYIPDKKRVPAMDAERYIMVRELGNDWYMFKTR